MDSNPSRWYVCQAGTGCHRIFPEKSDLEDHFKTQHFSNLFGLLSGSDVDIDLRDKYTEVTIHSPRVTLRRLSLQQVEESRAKLKDASLKRKIAIVGRKKRTTPLYFSKRVFKCDVCRKTFPKKVSLQAHLATHKGHMPYTCTICSKSFRLESMLRAHRLTHGEKSVSCTYCNRHFRDKYQLSNHLSGLSQSGALGTVHQCSLCPETYPNKACLLFHSKMSHLPPSRNPPSNRIRPKSTKGAYKCSSCSKTFSYQLFLTKHLENQGKSTMECLRCTPPAVFNNRACLIHHSKTLHKEDNDDAFHSEVIAQSKTESGSYNCKYCTQTYTNFSLLHKHMSTHKEKAFSCPICLKSYKSLWNLKYHRLSHTGTQRFVCPELNCGKSFLNPRTFHNHKIVHNEELKKFSCPLCGKRFAKASNLELHKKGLREEGDLIKCEQAECKWSFRGRNCLNYHLVSVHGMDIKNVGGGGRKSGGQEKKAQGPRVRFCRYCGKDCVYEHKQIHHEYLHTGERPYKCDFPDCTKSFRMPNSLSEHKRTHGEVKAFKCAFCPKCFKTRSVHAQHQKTHREKTNKCPHCQIAFQHKKSIEKHLKGYNEDHNFSCELCPTSFKNKRCKQHHFKSVHLQGKGSFVGEEMVIAKGSERITCKFCGKQEKYMSILKRHQSEPGDFSCGFCTLKFPYKFCLIHHKKTLHKGLVVEKEKTPNSGNSTPKKGPILKKCPFCDQSFKNSAELEAHVRVEHGEKPYKCSHCSKGFRLNSHLREHETIHSGIKRYKCEICGTSFRLASTRHSHIKTVHKTRNNRFPMINKRKKTKFNFRKKNSGSNSPAIVIKSGDFKAIIPEGRAIHAASSIASQMMDIVIKEEIIDGESPSGHFAHLELENNPNGDVDVHRHLKEEEEINFDRIPSHAIKVEAFGVNCGLCTSSFEDEGGLQAHMAQAHGLRQEICKICDEVFQDRVSLRRHVKSVHIIKGL